jgi:hypothetical protein
MIFKLMRTQEVTGTVFSSIMFCDNDNNFGVAISFSYKTTQCLGTCLKELRKTIIILSLEKVQGRLSIASSYIIAELIQKMACNV